MRTDCRICHGRDLSLILKLAPTPIGDEFLITPKPQPLHPIDLYQCADCGLAQLLYEIPPEEIYKDYIYLTGSSVGLDDHFRQYAQDVSNVCELKPGDAVVDIGSNDGTLLKHFKALGMEVCGYEPSDAISPVARAAGIPTIGAYFSRSVPEFTVITGGYSVKPKLITANNVLANVNDLDSFMEGVVRLLADDGYFVFESFYLGDVVNKMVFDFIYHEHLSAFSVKPVKRLLARYGMQLVKTEHVPTKGGSIRYYCQRYYAAKGKAAAVNDDDPTLYEPQTYVDFNARIEYAKAQTRAFLDSLRNMHDANFKIAGFGASISCTTLLYHFGLGEYLDYLVDDNPAKQGRFSPGLHLPVYPVSELYKRRPDYVLCLAWRFAADFKRAHPSFSTVVPLPRFQWAIA